MPQTPERKREYMQQYMRQKRQNERELTDWKQRLSKVNEEYKIKSAFPKWLYEIRQVQRQLLREKFNKKAIRVYRWVIPNPSVL